MKYFHIMRMNKREEMRMKCPPFIPLSPCAPRCPRAIQQKDPIKPLKATSCSENGFLSSPPDQYPQQGQLRSSFAPRSLDWDGEGRERFLLCFRTIISHPPLNLFLISC